jgi:predicted RNA binding protein YcfA (HicA-like mRNA interferase family)
MIRIKVRDAINVLRADGWTVVAPPPRQPPQA